MWARVVDGAWVEARPPFKIGELSFPPNIISVWSEAELAAIGIYEVIEQAPAAGLRATGWELVDVDGDPVRRPTGTETIPPADLTRLQFWGLVAALDAAGLQMTTKLNAAASGSPAIALTLAHANLYPWADFAALAVATGATTEEMAAVEAAWRGAGA